jgi:hypothetical protein
MCVSELIEKHGSVAPYLLCEVGELYEEVASRPLARADRELMTPVLQLPGELSVGFELIRTEYVRDASVRSVSEAGGFAVALDLPLDTDVIPSRDGENGKIDGGIVYKRMVSAPYRIVLTSDLSYLGHQQLGRSCLDHAPPRQHRPDP